MILDMSTSIYREQLNQENSSEQRGLLIFKDEKTLKYVEETILEKGEYTGNVRGAERYGYQFKEPIGYRIDANGNQISLYYGEMKVSAGKYHVIPRTKPSK